MNNLVIRGSDKFGYGYFGASRDGGKRKHNGVDIITNAGDEVLALGDGTVTKLGYPYRGDYHYRYVQVTNKAGEAWRYFYVDPSVELGLKIVAGKSLGKSQDLQPKYPGITQHVHFEIMVNGQYIDPTKYVTGDFK